MFSEPPEEQEVNKALELAELLQRYFAQLEVPDLLAASQTNKQWGANADYVFNKRFDSVILQLNNLEDKKLVAQMMAVAPLLTNMILRNNQNPEDLRNAANGLIKLIREMSANLHVPTAVIIKHFATTDRCYAFTPEQQENHAFSIELPVILHGLFKIEYQTGCRLTNFIQVSHALFPMQILMTHENLMEQFIKLSEIHQLSFIDTYLLLYFKIAEINSAWREDNPVKDCQRALEYMNANMAECKEQLGGLKKHLKELGMGDDLTATFAKMDDKAFDCMLARIILDEVRHDPKENNHLVTALAGIAKANHENLLITLQRAVGLLKQDSTRNNADVLTAMGANTNTLRK